MTMPRATHCSALLALASLAMIPPGGRAEEGGSGHYLPGAMASFMDGVAPEESFLVRYNLLHYDGAIGLERSIPIAGIAVADTNVTTRGHGLTVFWRPPVDLGERWSYAMSATVPFIDLDVSGNVRTTLPGGRRAVVRRSDHVSALGDIVVQPLMLNYKATPDFNVNMRVSVYTPTGVYHVGRLANAGKNFWTIEPTIGLMYYGQKNGREASLFIGADFNSENNDTDYRSGTQVHLDGTFAQHFPLAGGLAGVGINAFYYDQVTGDSGAGATFGDFEAKTTGAGPTVSFVKPGATGDWLAELKWLHEFNTERRPEGDTIFLKVAYKFHE